MSIVREIDNEPKRFKTTLAIYSLFTCHGLVLGLMGPTSMDLAIACETPISSVIHITTGRAGGLLLGSFVTPFFYTHLDVPALLAFGTLISAFITIAVPFVVNVYALIAIFFLLGCNMGAFESAATVFLIDLWGKANVPFMRLVHVFFGLGAFFSPFLAVAFLVDERSTSQMHLHDTRRDPFNQTLDATDKLNYSADDLMLLYPYLMVAIVMAFTSIALLVVRLFYHETEPHPTRMQNLTLCPTHGIGELFIDSCTPDDLKLSRIIHPDVSRIVNAHIDKVSHVNAPVTSPTCGKCNRVRRFTFSNNGNALAIVSNSSAKPRATFTSEPTARRDSTPLTSPLSSPLTSPLSVRRELAALRSFSVASDCSQCEPPANGVAKCHPVSNFNGADHKETNIADQLFHNDQVQQEYKIVVIVLCAFFLHFYCGLTSFGTLVSPFAVLSTLNMSKKAAALLSSLYWGAFAFSRILTFFFVSIFDSKSWILLNVFFCLFSNVFLVPFGSQYQWTLWIGSMIMGIGLNAIWMSIIGYIEQFMPITSRIMATFTCSAYIGQILFPSIVSPFIENYPIVLMWISFSYSFAMLLFLTAIIYICSYKLSDAHSTNQ